MTERDWAAWDDGDWDRAAEPPIEPVHHPAAQSLPGMPGWKGGSYRQHAPSSPWTTVAIVVAVICVIVGLAMLAFVVILFSALSQYGSNK